MISKRELLDAIREYESTPCSTYQTCEKLANLYTIYDHLYGNLSSTEISVVDVVETNGTSEFLQTINGMEVSEILPVLDELMSCLQVTQPRLYKSVLNRLTPEGPSA